MNNKTKLITKLMMKTSTYYRKMTIEANIKTVENELTLDEIMNKITVCIEKGAKCGGYCSTIGHPVNNQFRSILRLYDQVKTKLESNDMHISKINQDGRYGCYNTCVRIGW